MKFQNPMVPARSFGREARGGFSPRPRPRAQGPASAFTMIEIAICLAIVGFALVAIIGVLPIGMNTQRDNREETIINQDALMLINAVRTGARGADDLTNYVYAITNYSSSAVVGYDNNGYLTSGARIVGLMSTAEYLTAAGMPTNLYVAGGVSNHVVAYVRSLSGLAAEKPPQNSAIMVSGSFGYRIVCANAPLVVNNPATPTQYDKQLQGSQWESRLTFLWPQLPNGNVGGNRQAFRATIAGQIIQTNDTSVTPNVNLYFYQPQTFTNAP